MASVSSAHLAILLHLAGIAAFSASLPNGQVAAYCAASGDIAFRKSDFASAESLYRRALAEDDACARAVWGLGRHSKEVELSPRGSPRLFCLRLSSGPS